MTPDNNAVVLLCKAIGPRREGEAMPEGFYRWLGIAAPPEQGDYFIGLMDYVKKQPPNAADSGEAIVDNLDRCVRRPWSAQQFPVLAGWLRANENPLAVAVDASKRSRYFAPRVPPRKDGRLTGLNDAPVPTALACREIGRALAARAMLSLERERYDDAWRDLYACQRLGRLVARSGTLIESLIGIAVDRIASEGQLAILSSPGADRMRVKQCLHQLQALPPMPPLADKFELGQRFLFLGAVLMTARHGNGYFQRGVLNIHEPTETDPQLEWVFNHVDWDSALRVGNHWYDRLAAAMRIDDRAAREQQMTIIDEQILDMKADVSVQGLQSMLDARTSERKRGKLLGELILATLAPATLKVRQTADRSEQLAQRPLRVRHRGVPARPWALPGYARRAGPGLPCDDPGGPVQRQGDDLSTDGGRRPAVQRRPQRPGRPRQRGPARRRSERAHGMASPGLRNWRPHGWNSNGGCSGGGRSDRILPPLGASPGIACQKSPACGLQPGGQILTTLLSIRRRTAVQPESL